MGQRLGIAAALLGDPRTVMLDEPVNGLDPEGIRWIRDLLKQLAAEGRTVFVSSHLMSEMALTAEHLIVIGRGRLIADVGVDEFVRRHSKQIVRVRSPQADELAAALAGADVSISSLDAGVARGRGAERAAGRRVRCRTATDAPRARRQQQASLEEAFMTLTQDDIEFRTHATIEAAAPEAEIAA